MGEHSTQPHVGSPKAGSSKHAAAASSAFTPEMRDRQARGRNPYNSDSDDSGWGLEQGSRSRDGGSSSAAVVGFQRIGPPKSKEHFAICDRRRMAAQILNSTELLMMAAVRDDESIPATRLKYTRILCGLEGSGDGTARAAAAGPGRPSIADRQRKRSNLDQGQGRRSVSGNPSE
ncbi:hypothetical protein F4801DRAFT_26380 [Xylaria longipes]|nr:hypothetical protein F4801DRAFT_26380 [Xylaria longipes]RYC61683.1 hypothetical protein CHU98_g4549 [Xylaria longipes]